MVVFIDDKSAYVQVMAWCRTDNKPLPELMLADFCDALLRRHYATVS